MSDCETCGGARFKSWRDYPSGTVVSSCGVCGWDIQMVNGMFAHAHPEGYLLYHYGRSLPFRIDHTIYPKPCQDCVPNPESSPR